MTDDNQRMRFNTWPWSLRIIGLVALVPAFLIPAARHDVPLWPPIVIGLVLMLVRSVVEFDPRGRWLQHAVGIGVPFFRFGRTNVTQVILQERTTGSHKRRRRDYHVMVAGDGLRAETLSKHRSLESSRKRAEHLATSAHLPLLDLVTGAGLRPAGTLNESLRAQIRRAGWRAQALGPSGRLRTKPLAGGGVAIAFPALSVVSRVLWPLGFSIMFALAFGTLAVLSLVGVGKTAHDPIFIAICGVPATIALIALVANVVIHQDRFFRVDRIEVTTNGLVVHGSRFGRVHQRHFDLDEIESIGVGRQARLTGYARDTAHAVVIASDRQVASIGCGLTSGERAWLAGFVTQAITVV